LCAGHRTLETSVTAVTTAELRAAYLPIAIPHGGYMEGAIRWTIRESEGAGSNERQHDGEIRPHPPARRHATRWGPPPLAIDCGRQRGPRGGRRADAVTYTPASNSSAISRCLGTLFVISAVVAGWVSDLTDPGFADLASRLGHVETWQAWLRPASIATLGVVQIGIALILWGIVLRLWGCVEALTSAIPVFIERGKESGKGRRS